VGPKLPIYLDHHATTPLDPRVFDAMLPYFERDFGNAASTTHVFGWRAEAAVENARESLAAGIGARDPREICFTSGSTESDNLALKGAAFGLAAEGDHIVTTRIEHPAVLDACTALERQGRRVTRLAVDAVGRVDPADVARAIDERTVLVSVMAANSEIGVIQPLAEIALASFSAHKMYGPKGVGALYVRRRRPRIRLEPLLHGGGHERGLRSGTLPVPLIVGFARALEIALEDRDVEAARLASLRDRLLARLEEGLEGVRLTGPRGPRLPGNLHVCLEGVQADQVLVEMKDVALSSGSACSSARPEPSHVLQALGLPDRLLRSGLRIGIGRPNTTEEIDWVGKRLVQVVRELRAAQVVRSPGRSL
jgi:cysteine desulfurase